MITGFISTKLRDHRCNRCGPHPKGIGCVFCSETRNSYIIFKILVQNCTVLIDLNLCMTDVKIDALDSVTFFLHGNLTSTMKW